MTTLNIDDVVMLIHTEVASAISSAQRDGMTEHVQLQSVRVRMGNASNDHELDDGDATPAIDHQRYPPSESGWLIDVNYEAKLPTQPSKGLPDNTEKKQWLASQSLSYIARQPVIHLDGVGQQRSLYLEEHGIFSIADLSNMSVPARQSHNQLTPALLRKLQTLAQLALAVPPISIPSSINDFSLMELIEQFDAISAEYLVGRFGNEYISQLRQWFQQLEFCFDDDFFDQLTINQLRGAI